MNYKVIEENLKYCERMEKDSPLEACVTALGMAGLVIQQAIALVPDKQPTEITEAEMALLRQAYGIAAGGITTNLKKFTDVAGLLYQPDIRMPGMKKKFEENIAELREKDEIWKTETMLNSELIKAAEALESRIAYLEKTENVKKDGLKKMEEKISIQEQSNKELEKRIQEKEEELQNLKTRFQKSQEELARYETALQENSTLLQNLPEKYGIASIDDALELAADVGNSVNEAIAKGDEVLNTVIHAIDAFYNGEK